MADYDWVLFESWHIVGENNLTMCGLDIGEQDVVERKRSDHLPLDQKSCENCLRVRMGREEAGLIV